MRLRAHDQVHVSSVKAESLRPGEEFEVSDAAGADLIKAHPGLFEEVRSTASATDQKAEPAPTNKAEPEPENKTVSAPLTATRRDTRRDR
jgi:hypothetical protein